MEGGLEYGLIGEKLGHSFSPAIHRRLAGYDYRLVELRPEELGPLSLIHISYNPQNKPHAPSDCPAGHVYICSVGAYPEGQCLRCKFRKSFEKNG